MRKYRAESLKVRANVLLAIQMGHKTVADISGFITNSYSSVLHHIEFLTDKGNVKLGERVARQDGNGSSQEYIFIHDNDDIIEQYAHLPKKVEVPESPFLRKMMGYTDIAPAKNGRVYNEAKFNQIKREQRYTRWTPYIKKKFKNEVSGGSLLWF